MNKAWMTTIALGAALLAVPALADVKAGVDAWGRGDYKRAVAEWRGPAVAGDADAQFNLGQAYKLGRGVPVDLGLAEQWYGKAARQGHPQAGENYGLALFQNNKRSEALPWLEAAAKRGEPRAQFVLGTMLFNGDVVAKDWVRAYALITRASASGLAPASQSLAQMDEYVSLEERQRGLALARTYEREAQRPQLASAIDQPTHSPPRRTPAPPSPTPPRDAQLLDSVEDPMTDQPAPVRRPGSAAPTTPRDGGWRVQLGAFGDPGNARKLWGQIAGRFPGRQPSYVKAGALTKLLVGPFASNAEATRACAAVKPCVAVRK